MRKQAWKFCVLGASALLVALQGRLLAHEGHHQDPYHLHRSVAGTEVALQIKSRTAFASQLKQSGLKLAIDQTKGSHLLVVVLSKGQRWVQGRVMIKLTDAEGNAVGNPSGIEPKPYKDKQGLQYLFPVNLQSKQNYFALVQFKLDNQKIQRAGFQFQSP